MTLTQRDDKNGVVIDISPNVVNSMLIAETMTLLDRAKKAQVAVEIHTHDDTTYRSLKCVGIDKLATLKLVPN